MNKKILIVLLLTLVSLIGVPGALAADQTSDSTGTSASTSTMTRQVTETSRVTETPRITATPRETATPRITETPRVTATSRVPTPVPEFPSIVLPIAAVIGLMMLLLYRRDK